tara:strand:+ start:4714 stop:5277 length:564 start_codon:yes stop_codon:yes gene_type:complete
MKVHVGSGKNYLQGWINCDINSNHKYDREWDLLSSVTPFDDNSVDYIFTEHVLEHFTLKQAISILKTFRSVMKQGAVLRVVVPSLESLIEGYLYDEHFLDTYNSTFTDRKAAFKAQLFNRTFYEYGHKNMFDKQLLLFALRSAGFRHCDVRFFDSDSVGCEVFEGVGRRKYKVNSSVKNLTVEVVKR